MALYDRFQDKTRKKLAVLVDPDKPTDAQIISIVEKAKAADVDFSGTVDRADIEWFFVAFIDIRQESRDVDWQACHCGALP